MGKGFWRKNGPYITKGKVERNILDRSNLRDQQNRSLPQIKEVPPDPHPEQKRGWFERFVGMVARSANPIENRELIERLEEEQEAKKRLQRINERKARINREALEKAGKVQPKAYGGSYKINDVSSPNQHKRGVWGRLKNRFRKPTDQTFSQKDFAGDKVKNIGNAYQNLVNLSDNEKIGLGQRNIPEPESTLNEDAGRILKQNLESKRQAEAEEQKAEQAASRAEQAERQAKADEQQAESAAEGSQQQSAKDGEGRLKKAWNLAKKPYDFSQVRAGEKKLNFNKQKSKFNPAMLPLDRSRSLIFIFLAFFIHYVIKFSFNFRPGPTWTIDIFMAFVVYFVIYNEEERNEKGFRSIMFILFLEIGASFLFIQLQTYYPNKFTYYYLANRLLTPWWFYYAVIRANDCIHPKRLAGWIQAIVIIFWIGVLLSTPAIGFTKISPVDYIGAQQSELAFDYVSKSVFFYKDFVWDTGKRALRTLGDAYEKQLKIATGGYYKGRVDENQNTPLGVYIEKVKPTAPDFYEGSAVTVYGNVRVLSLDDAIKLNFNCFHGRRDSEGNAPEGSFADIVYPDKELWLYDLENAAVDCEFNDLNHGTNTITMTADFNFETMAYQKTYFMDRDTIRSLIAQDKDPLAEYGIDEPHPIAIYTSGPVMVGMELQSPVAIDSDSPNQPQTFPRLGITVESNTGWMGRIRQLNELFIIVPDSMSIKTSTCNGDFKEIKADDDTKNKGIEGYKKYRTKQFKLCQQQKSIPDEAFDGSGQFTANYQTSEEEKVSSFEDCLKEEWDKETEGHKVYYLDIAEKDPRYQNIESFKSFNCRLKIDKPSEVLGFSPLATNYVFAKARYDYQLDKEVAVTVKRSVDLTEVPEDITGKARITSEELGNVVHKWVEIINKESSLKGKMPKDINDQSLLSDCFVLGLIATESYGDPDAVSSKGALGLMQVMDETAKGVLKDIWENDQVFFQKFEDLKQITYQNYEQDIKNVVLKNQELNVLLGTYYLTQRLINTKNSLPENRGEGNSLLEDKEMQQYALAEYNAGPEQVKYYYRNGEKTEQERCIDNNKKYIYFDDCFKKLPEKTQNHNERTFEYKKVCEEENFDSLAEAEEEIELKWLSGEMTFYPSYNDETIKNNIYTDNGYYFSLDDTNKATLITEIKSWLYNKNQEQKKKEYMITIYGCAGQKSENQADNEYIQEIENCINILSSAGKLMQFDDSVTLEETKEFLLKEDEVKKYQCITNTANKIKKEYKKVDVKEEIIQLTPSGLDQKKTKFFVKIPKTKIEISNSEGELLEKPEIKIELYFNRLIKLSEQIIKVGAEENTDSEGYNRKFGKNVFVKTKFEGCQAENERYKCIIKYKFADKFIVNSKRLENNLKGEEDYIYSQLNNLLKIRRHQSEIIRFDYGNAEIILVSADNKEKICGFEWEGYENEKKCDDIYYANGLGLSVVDLFNPKVDGSVREDFAYVQVKFDPYEFKADCCNDEKYIEQELCGSYRIATCDIDSDFNFVDEEYKTCKIERSLGSGLSSRNTFTVICE